MFLVMAYSFAKMAVGRRHEDALIISRLKDENERLRFEHNEEVECENCNGTGQIIDYGKINSRSIDVPYKYCEECGGSGIKNN